MKDKEFENLMKQAEELAKSIGYDSKPPSTEENLSLKIMQKIKQSLDENDLDITITPLMYNPEDFTPVLGVLVKNEDSSYTRKYTITVKPNN